MDKKKPLAKKEDLVIQELPDELLIYDISTGKAFCLNETSAFVWKNADGEKSVSEIAQLMKSEYKSPVDEDLVWLALDQLGKDELLEIRPESKFADITRREIIRRVGLSSLIALPIVASLITTSYAAGCSSALVVSVSDCLSVDCTNRACSPCGNTGSQQGTCQAGACVC